MIVMSPEIKAALESSPQVRTEELDMDIYSDLIAGESVIRMEGRRLGVLRYERKGTQATAWLIELNR